MNKSSLLTTLLLVSPLAMYSMDQLSTLPDCSSVEQGLHDDYKNYLREQLELYKTKNKTVRIEKLVSMASTIQSIKPSELRTYPDNNIAQDILDTTDEHGNNFVHIAVEKDDMKTLQQFTGVRARFVLQKNHVGKTAIDLCIDKLSSDMTYHTKTRIEILEDMLYRAAHISRSQGDACLQEILQKVIDLQIKYKQNKTELPIKTEHLKRLAAFRWHELPLDKQYELLSPFYQKATDKDSGNTLTHIAVEQENADELSRLIRNGRVSFAKNKANWTPFDLALREFRYFTQNPALINENRTSFTNRRCCFFLLLNYAKKLKNDSQITVCCDKHASADHQQNEEQIDS